MREKKKAMKKLDKNLINKFMDYSEEYNKLSSTELDGEELKEIDYD